VSALRLLGLAGLAVLLTGCATAPTQKYNWGSYDPSLYGYYRDPTKVADLVNSLDAIIKAADTKHTRVPPGIYAEYGYLQLQQGNAQEAIRAYQQEQALWPESRVFMDRMIKVASLPVAGSTNPSH